jgi:hypothetical protein
METPRYHIVMSEDALLMLDHHVEFLARVSTAAQRMADQLMDDVESLAEICGLYLRL